MTFSIRTASLGALFLAATFAAGCDGGDVDPGADAGPPIDCSDTPKNLPCDSDRACVGGFCEIADGESFGCCKILVCLSNADCADNEKCDVRRGLCVPKNLCDPAQENGGQCEGGDCCQAGQFCEYVDGSPQCVDPSERSTECFIAAGGRPIASAAGDTEAFPAVTAAGQDIQLEAVGTDASGKIVPHATFTWTGANADGVVTAPACAAGVCDVTVTATSGSASCDGVVRVYAAPTAGSNRIVVLDLATGEPLSGVDVAGSAAGTVTPGTTDADGAFEFAAGAAADAISAFPATHQWHTVVSPPNDVIIYTSRIPDNTRAAGIKGTFDFSSVHTTGDIKLGLAGTAIASSITDLNFATLIGDIADYNVELEGLTDPGGQLVPLPSGLVIELGSEPIKGDYVTFGEPGKNIAWAIGGQVALADVGPIISGVASGGGDVNIGSILGGVLPFFAKFDHATVTGLDLVEGAKPQPDPANPDAPIPTSEYPFDDQVLKPNTLLALSANYTMPDLPCTPGGFNGGNCTAPSADVSPFATGAVLLTGAIVPGVGLVPLGLTAGLDDPKDDGSQVDGKLDSDAEGGPGKGEAIIDYAPAHDGLEGNLLISVAIALDINAVSDTSGGFGASIITHVTNKFGDTNTFPQTFLESQGGTFTPGEAGSFAIEPTGDADFWRVNFDDGGETEWNVWFADDAATFAPGDFHPDAAAAAARFQHADVQAFKLGTGYGALRPGQEPTSFDELFAFDGKNLDNLLYYLGAWSSEACKAGGHCTDTAAQP